MNTYKPSQIDVQVGYLIVEPQEVKAEVAGIYQPNKEQEVPQWGTVIALGDLRAGENGEPEFPTITLKEGQTVIYKKWGGNDVEIGGKKYYFLKYEEVIGAINE